MSRDDDDDDDDEEDDEMYQGRYRDEVDGMRKPSEVGPDNIYKVWGCVRWTLDTLGVTASLQSDRITRILRPNITNIAPDHALRS